MRVLLTVTTLVAVVSATSVSLEDLEFQEWKLKYGKSYDSEEEESQRKMIWMTNLKLVLEHNMLADQGLKTYRLGMNHFADMCNSSPLNRVKGEGLNPSLFCNIHLSQAGALEGQMFRKTGSLVSLSTQQLVDCSWLDGNDGCGGGSMELAFEYISRSGGLQTESDYPYKAREGMCMFNPQNVSGKCHDFEELPKGEEKDLQKAVVAVGPVSVAIDSSNKTFLLYQSGIYNEPYCSSYNVNHGVLVVGYNTDSSGREYWVVKNSWGVQWGEQGYIRMSRNKDNQCGIATRASFPLV
uniref:Cathepsin L.1 n=1 Tax=Astyanax mexicanus TaxID=7994 RepID=A0A8B9LFW5_ASTMX